MRALSVISDFYRVNANNIMLE